jgi:hypothetical protein
MTGPVVRLSLGLGSLEGSFLYLHLAKPFETFECWFRLTKRVSWMLLKSRSDANLQGTISFSPIKG